MSDLSEDDVSAQGDAVVFSSESEDSECSDSDREDCNCTCARCEGGDCPGKRKVAYASIWENSPTSPCEETGGNINYPQSGYTELKKLPPGSEYGVWLCDVYPGKPQHDRATQTDNLDPVLGKRTRYSGADDREWKKEYYLATRYRDGYKKANPRYINGDRRRHN